jgi:chromate transporter
MTSLPTEPAIVIGTEAGLPRISAGELFLGFLAIGIQGFGGVLPWARKMIVEERHWLSAVEFTDLLSLCQLLPGPNILNLSVILGTRSCGLKGAASAVAGLMAAPTAIVLGLGMLYARYGANPALDGVFRNLGAAAAGLVLAAGWKIAKPYARRPEAMLFAGLAFASAALLHLPVVWTVLALAPLSVGAAWIMRK